MQNGKKYFFFDNSDKILKQNFACCVAMVPFIKKTRY